MENSDSFDGVHIEGSENGDFAGNSQRDGDDVEGYEQTGRYSPTPGGSRELSPRSSWSPGRDCLLFWWWLSRRWPLRWRSQQFC